MTHRMEMAEKEIQEMKKNLKQMEQRCTKRRANLTARLEDAELRIWETKEMKREFKEKILEQGVDFITGKIPAEKYVRYCLFTFLKNMKSFCGKKDASLLEVKRLKKIGTGGLEKIEHFYLSPTHHFASLKLYLFLSPHLSRLSFSIPMSGNIYLFLSLSLSAD